MDNNENVDIENKKHIEKVYTDQASTLLTICIVIEVFSLITYFIGIFVYESFDFGLIFETIALIVILFSKNMIAQNDFQSVKRNVIIAMIPLGWLVIYDFIDLLAHLNEVLVNVATYYLSFDQYSYSIEPYLYDVTLIASIGLLYKAYSSLCKADGSKKAENYTEDFYDKL